MCHLSSNFLRRTVRSLQRIYLPYRCQHVRSPPELVVERALRSIKLDSYETTLVRNFCIIAHVDHGMKQYFSETEYMIDPRSRKVNSSRSADGIDRSHT